MYFKTLIRTITVLIFIALSYTTFSQIGSGEKKIASSIAQMKMQLNNLKNKKGFSNDSLRIEVMNRIAALYIQSSKDSAISYADNALKLSNALKQKDLIAVSFHNLGKAYDYYKDSLNAEVNYLEWYKTRKEQGEDKFRWALQGMREFYSKYKQIDKLEKIEEEWMSVLDKQYDEKHASPWIPDDYTDPMDHYRFSMNPVFNNLIELKEFNLAGKLFEHMVKKCPDYKMWLDGDMPFFRIENILLESGDTSALSVWYDQWYHVLENYCTDKSRAFETLKIISGRFLGGWRYPGLSEKYFQKMLNYTYRLGADSAAYAMIQHSLNSGGCEQYEIIKLHLFSIKICIKTNNIEDIDLHYKALESAIESGYMDKNTRFKISNLISSTEKNTNDERLKIWCHDALKKIY